MADTLTDVLVCAYPNVEAADKDFENLTAPVGAKQVGIQAPLIMLWYYNRDNVRAYFGVDVYEQPPAA